MIGNKAWLRAAVISALGICLLPTLRLRAQETQAPLGDVVRKQQAEREHGRKAKRIIGDEDVGGFHLHEVSGDAATTVIIPNVRITGMVPDGVSLSGKADSKQKMRVWFGPGTLDRCFDLDCAKEIYLSMLPLMIGGSGKVLFESDDSIEGNPVRVVHFEVTHEVRGKILGTVALIQTPVAAGAATCTYQPADASDVESDCDAFIRSLRVHMPERYIYVQHNQ